VIVSVKNGLTMCNFVTRCVAISAIPSAKSQLTTGMIGLHGKVTGFATLNMAEQVAMQTVEGLLQEKFGKRCPQAVPSSGALKWSMAPEN